MFTLFGALALLLAAVGVYGVKAYVVSRRTREIGIRMALGAEPRDVLWMMLKEGLVLTGLGLGIGLLLSAGLAKLVSSMLYGVERLRPARVRRRPARPGPRRPGGQLRSGPPRYPRRAARRAAGGVGAWTSARIEEWELKNSRMAECGLLPAFFMGPMSRDLSLRPAFFLQFFNSSNSLTLTPRSPRSACHRSACRVGAGRRGRLPSARW